MSTTYKSQFKENKDIMAIKIAIAPSDALLKGIESGVAHCVGHTFKPQQMLHETLDGKSDDIEEACALGLMAIGVNGADAERWLLLRTANSYNAYLNGQGYDVVQHNDDDRERACLAVTRAARRWTHSAARPQALGSV